jgi:hypothetical protein
MTPEQLAYLSLGLSYGTALGYAVACVYHDSWSGVLGSLLVAIALTVAIKTGAMVWAIRWAAEVLA